MKNNNIKPVNVTLTPADSHKSFYGKAHILRDESTGVLYLKSYDTIVCAFKSGAILKLWNDYSATTMRHINAFCAYCGLDVGGKAWWDKLPMAWHDYYVAMGMAA